MERTREKRLCCALRILHSLPLLLHSEAPGCSCPAVSSCPLCLGVWEDNLVLYQSVVGALRLYTLLDRCYDARQTPVQGGEVGLSQDGRDGVEGQRLAHR